MDLQQSFKSYVIKRNGNREPVYFDKITERLIHLCNNIEPKLNPDHVDPVLVAQKVVAGIFNGVKTSELDKLAAETAGTRYIPVGGSDIFSLHVYDSSRLRSSGGQDCNL